MRAPENFAITWPRQRLFAPRPQSWGLLQIWFWKKPLTRREWIDIAQQSLRITQRRALINRRNRTLSARLCCASQLTICVSAVFFSREERPFWVLCFFFLSE